MRPDLERLLGVTRYRAFDTDGGGRILAGSDESGSTQLVEISPDGQATALTALPGACTGRYVTGERAVIVSHDDGGNERHQLSLLALPAAGEALAKPAAPDDLRPLVRDPDYMHTLADVTSGRICYFTNRRDGVAFDPVIRDLATGAERTISLGDVMLAGGALSPDGRWLALTVLSAVTANAEHVVLVDLAGPPGQEPVIAVTVADDPAMNGALAWLPGSDALIWSSNTDREFTAVARYDLATQLRTWLITDDGADLTGWPSPDGSLILVARNDDGASVLTLHDAASGQALRDVPLPAPGSVADAMLPGPGWSADSAAVTMTITGAQLPGDVLLADATTGGVRQVTYSAAGLDGTPVAIPQRHQIPTPDGETVPCLVYRAGVGGGVGLGDGAAGAGLAGSAVLVVHGGPEGQATQNYNPYVQVLAAAGHTVLVPNVRGSTGYGKRWYSLDDKELRLDSVADLAAIHAYLPTLGVDPGRAALWGGSYGGYMVLAGLAFQPELWAAGVDIVGISSLVTFLENTSAFRCFPKNAAIRCPGESRSGVPVPKAVGNGWPRTDSGIHRSWPPLASCRRPLLHPHLARGRRQLRLDSRRTTDPFRPPSYAGRILAARGRVASAVIAHH
jgi:dipeptidyl aminopeptidase/acylaminoacyl peptidase